MYPPCLYVVDDKSIEGAMGVCICIVSCLTFVVLNMVVEGANATELGAWPRSITPMKHRHLARWNIDGMVFVLLGMKKKVTN